MTRLSLSFNEDYPHRNDERVQQYLSQNKLEPKRVSQVQIGSERFKVLHFGQCYLDSHLDRVSELAEAQSEGNDD
ncbi:MAG: hypothetical protein EXR48_06045 [Dehalococcoidia bacterium]|nr:hypothetical protein [Dehalococcoidia bacterium]